MKRIHALIIALALGIAVVAGTFAALRTTQLGAGSQATATQVSSVQISKQNRALNRAEAALRAELKKKPPAIAAVPANRMPTAGLPAAPPASAQTVIYHRPPPVVRVVHRPGGGGHDDGSSGSGQGGLDD